MPGHGGKVEVERAGDEDGPIAGGPVGIDQGFRSGIDLGANFVCKGPLGHRLQPLLFEAAVLAIEDDVEEPSGIKVEADEKRNACQELGVFQRGAQARGEVFGEERVAGDNVS